MVPTLQALDYTLKDNNGRRGVEGNRHCRQQANGLLPLWDEQLVHGQCLAMIWVPLAVPSFRPPLWLQSLSQITVNPETNGRLESWQGRGQQSSWGYELPNPSPLPSQH